MLFAVGLELRMNFIPHTGNTSCLLGTGIPLHEALNL